jgi:hypothetical protein
VRNAGYRQHLVFPGPAAVKLDSGLPMPFTPQELESDEARVVTVVIYLDLGPGSAIAVETARQLAPMLYPLLD